MPHTRPRSRPPQTRAYRFVAFCVRHLGFSLWKYDWRGQENFPTKGGFIAAANHVTEIDPLPLAHFVYDSGYEPRILAKRSLFDSPVGFALRWTNMIPVDRGTKSSAQSLADAGKLLGDGAAVVILPEGTLTRDPDLWPMVAKTGMARMALASKLPVVPIAQWGAHKTLPRYGRVPSLFPRKKVVISVGEPVDLSDLYDKPLDSAVLAEATERVMDAITGQLAEIRGEEPPKHRFDLRKHPEYNAKRTDYPPVERP
ncbi:lysophospholipid acyltransferase family protein [Myceligenerans pegani]|uniref:1-acyl-sn-glycerol-3-phosphate acyltransferase n=1 Tax=Myceligenerans pegani TaxID=2776917 RepID=A0ABR9N379_9MICO|nr:lysophospholipid acyltransferase family protein [Myceligenerans sp. TRM 65318]MBE1878120.1 1-acyl-sn-glycerol-3-phosphate acyltransferase [Myceligenerans sp. TRM 65318]MBE3020391.1 1-acyl-sn-glycerol-3-phosphate acyltransferase [Myceligenerans sp. TRM 65318]